MKRLRAFLDRLWHRGDINVVDVIPANRATLDIVVRFAYDYLMERGEYVAPDVLGRLAGYFQTLLQSDARVLIAYKNDLPVGMVCCAMQGATAWDDRATGSVWMLYTVKNVRSDPRVVEALLRACGSVLLNAGMEICKVHVTDPHLAETYCKLIGFTLTQTAYIAEIGS